MYNIAYLNLELKIIGEMHGSGHELLLPAYMRSFHM